MRLVLLRACCFFALFAFVRAQSAKWDFSAGNGAPIVTPVNVAVGNLSSVNATLTFDSTQPSTGYTGASGGNSANVTAPLGSFSASASAYFTFNCIPTAGYRLYANSLTIGSRSTPTGPTSLALYSSADNFTSAVATATVSANSSWSLVTFSGFNLFGTLNSPLTFRLYGSGGAGGSAGAGNWRIDDVSLNIVAAPLGPVINTQPASKNVAPGTNTSLTVAAAGTGTLAYQWRKNGTPIDTNATPSAATATLSFTAAAAADSGSYDVIVTDSTGSTTSSAATLFVGITAATVTLGNLTATFDGTAHAVTVTTVPSGLPVSVTYNGVPNTPPTNAGNYTVVATVTDPAYAGSATDTLTINKSSPTITWNTIASNTPIVGVPFSVSASASSGVTPVRFSIFSGNATAAGTNNATITIADTTSPVVITATQAGDANNGAATGNLTVSAINTPNVTGTYTQNFDTLGTAGMPAGWRVFTGATATTLGTDVTGLTSSLALAATDWNSTSANFRNVASALNAGVSSTDSATVQSTYTNRALGVRQVISSNTNFGDPGAAMGFNFATPNVNVVSVSFSAQILSSQPNATTWLLQSGVGVVPTSWVTLATFTDPGAFGASTLSADASTFGTALNNRDSVWFRVVALSATTFGGTRDTFAIDNFTIVTGPTLSITTPPVAQTVTSGQGASFGVAAIGTGAPTYQWRKNGNAISGATNATLDFITALTTDAGNYDVVVTDAVGSVTSTPVALTVNPIATTFTLGNLSATYDGSAHAVTAVPAPPEAAFTVTYTGTGNTYYAGSQTPPTNPGVYLVTATATDSEHAGSTSALLVIGGAADAIPPTISAQSSAQTVGYGDVVQFSVTATGTPAPVYQWRKDGAAISGATNATYTIYGAAYTDAGNYDVVIANTGGSVASAIIALSVNKRSQTITFDAPAATAPAGTAVKLSATASSGLPVAFTIVSGAGTISGTSLTGRTGTVTVRAAQAGNAAYDAATSVDRTFTFTAAGGLSPFITSPPSDQTVNAGATVTFNASAIGTPAPTYQWQKEGVAISGATNLTLTLANVTLSDAARYTLVATNTAGTASSSASLIVRGAPVITTQPVTRSIFAGDPVTLAVAVTGVPVPTFQWRKNGTPISGATSAALAFASAKSTDTGRYDVVVTNSLGSTTSAAATLTVTTRDFSGDYFGHFAAGANASTPAGDFALHVHADGTAVLIGYVSGTQTGFVATNIRVDLAGNLSGSFASVISAAADAQADSAVPATAAATQSVTLRGTLSDATGALSASIPELGLTLDGARTDRTGAASAQAGYYSAAPLSAASGRDYVVVAPTGQAIVLVVTGSTTDEAVGTLGANGRLTATSVAKSTFDLGFSNGALNGTVKTAAGVTTTLMGAAETLAGTERLVNLSVRGIVAADVAPLITGFVITGTSAKQVLIRAAGPAIAVAPFNVAGALPDPAIQVMRGNNRVAQNDNWGAPAANAAAISAAVTKVGAFPFRNGSDDSAVLTTLNPGAYSVMVDNSAAGLPTNGIALAEIYEVLDNVEVPGARRLGNLSARSVVVPGQSLIAGFVITGTAPQRVLLRGVGPTLGAAPFNLSGVLPNPQITLYRGSTVVKANDDWFRDPEAATIRDVATRVGAFALGAQSLDAAILIYLQPGAYTVELTGPANANTNNGSGLVLIEIYEAP